MQNLNRLDGTGMRGRLTLERIADGTTILSGTTADVHTCPTCTNVGFVEYIVLGDRSLYQNRAMVGPRHDAYTQSFPPYRYAWLGPVETAGR